MPSSTSEVDETTFGEENDVPAGWHGEPVDLRLDVHDGHGILLQPSDVDLNVEVTNVGDDGVFGHDREVLASDDIPGAGSADEDVGAGSGIFHGRNLETGHGGLEGVDRVDLGDQNTSTIRPQRLGAALSDITVASDDGNLSGKHDIGSTLNTIDEGLAASVVVVKLALGNGVVDVNSGDLELALPEHTVEVVNTGGCLLGETPDAIEELRVFLVNVVGEVTTVVEDHVQRLATGETLDSLVNTPDVFLLGLTLPGEDGNASSGDGGGGMVLSGEDVAGRPGHLGTESSEGLNQDSGLDGHVQTSSNASALERFGTRVLLPHVHETWHLMLGDFDLLTAEGGKGDISDFEDHG